MITTAGLLIGEAFRNGGCTLTPNGNLTKLGDGWMIGGAIKALVLPPNAELVFRPVVEWLMTAESFAKENNAYIGSWKDPITGNLWFDVSNFLLDAEEAESLMRKRGESAIYNPGTGEIRRLN